MNQCTAVENRRQRGPVLELFGNGLPLGLMEFRKPADERAPVRAAWNQLQTHKAMPPSLFAWNAALIALEGADARVGTFTAGREWCKP